VKHIMGKHKIEELKKALQRAEESGSEEVELEGGVEEEEEEDEPEVTKGVEANIAKMAEKIGDKIAEAVVAKAGGTQRDKEDLSHSFLHDKRYGMNAVEYPTDLKSLNRDEKIITFFKALMYSQTDMVSNQVLRALVEGTDSEGGYLVPEEFRAEVFRILPDVSVMRRIARVIPMNTDTLHLNTLDARPSAYWTAEYASKATTSAEFGRVTLTPAKLVCLLPVTEELLADANINLVNFIVELFTEEIGRTEDKAYFTGSGTAQPKGINQETLTSVAAGGALNMDHVIAVIDSVPQRVSQQPGAAFVGHRYVKRLLRNLKDTNNNYIWRDGGTAPGGGTEVRRLPDTLYGYPFYEQNDLAQSELYFGDWKQYIIGDRQQLVVRTTMEGGDAWRRDSMEIKAKIRVDGTAVLTKAFAKVTGI